MFFVLYYKILKSMYWFLGCGISKSKALSIMSKPSTHVMMFWYKPSVCKCSNSTYKNYISNTQLENGDNCTSDDKLFLLNNYSKCFNKNKLHIPIFNSLVGSSHWLHYCRSILLVFINIKTLLIIFIYLKYLFIQ